jgi:hypothetical protein
LETEGRGGLTDGKGLALAIPLLFVAYPHTKLPHAKLVVFDGCFAAVYVHPFSAQNLRFVIVDVVSNFLSNTKKKPTESTIGFRSF